MMRLRPALFACALCVLPIACTAAPSRVERSLTTGDKLRAVDAARRGDQSWRAPGAGEVEIAAQRAEKCPEGQSAKSQSVTQFDND